MVKRPDGTTEESANESIAQKVAGLDVHKKEVVACLRLVIRGKAAYQARRFATTTRGLLGQSPL